MGLASLATRIRSYELPSDFEAKGFDVDLWYAMKVRENIQYKSFNINQCKSLLEGLSDPYQASLDKICADLKANYKVVSPDDFRI